MEESLTQIKKNYISPQRDHPYLTNDALRAYDFVLEELGESRSAIEKLLGTDEYCERLLKVFEGNVGPKPSSEVLDQLHAEAKERYEKQIPPGYLDRKKKDIPEAYGDYIAWWQLIQIAQSEKRGIVLVTDESKDDWWYSEGDHEQLSPQPQLLEEFALRSGQNFCLYNSVNFLRSVKKFMAVDIQDHVIEEVSLRLASQRETAAAANLKSVPVGSDIEKQAEKVVSGTKPSGDLKSAAAGILASDSDKVRPEDQ